MKKRQIIMSPNPPSSPCTTSHVMVHEDMEEEDLDDNYAPLLTTAPPPPPPPPPDDPSPSLIGVNNYEAPATSTSTGLMNYKDDKSSKQKKYSHKINKPLQQQQLKKPINKVRAKACPLVRVIQMSPPTLVTTKPEDFRSVVQLLTGSPSSSSSSSASSSSSSSSVPLLLPEYSSMPPTDVQPNMVANYEAAALHKSHHLPLHIRTRLAEQDNDFVLLATDRDDSSDTKTDSFMMERGLCSPEDESHGPHDCHDTSAQLHMSTTSGGAVSSTSPFFMAACFEELEGLADPFEAQSEITKESSNNDGAPCSSYTLMYGITECNDDLDAIDNFFDALDAAEGTLPASYPSLQSYMSHMNNAAAAGMVITAPT